MLEWLNEANARSYAFFRRCTLPSPPIMELLNAGRHEIGLHLENSRSLTTFLEEKQIVERHVGKPVLAMSKHGSGGAKFGFHHYAPYEPERYIDWARQSRMQLFLGNLQDPSVESKQDGDGLSFFPAAFWLETPWRETDKFPVDWLLDHARRRDIVLLVHPENVLGDPGLVSDFKKLIRTLESRILQ